MLRVNLVACVLVTGSAISQAPSFNRDVRPILAEKCFACHGPDGNERKGGLRLDRARDAYGKRRGRAAIVPGDPEASELMRRITHADPRKRMPPKKSHKTIDAREVEVLRRWIRAGAEYERHWAFVAARSKQPPPVEGRSKLGLIDRWILATLDAKGLAPARPANPVTLVRRLHFDLTGLPPTPKRVREFTRDPSQRAYERVVDHLLGSERFGERLASYWFDLVRAANTVGYHGDQEHAIAPYRDWVIRAFNANMPFDQFTIEQLAGDLLPRATESQKVATGYNRILQTTHEGGAQAKEYLTIYAADRVRNFGAVWLGLTTGCAQCHDHKYDPITQRDFYSLAAFFADITEKGDFQGSPNSTPTTRPPEIKVGDRRTMITVAKKPRMVRVLARGDWLDDSGKVVQPRTPEFLPARAARGRANRLDLARWLFHEDHPLTARVFVNRVWYLFFGVGLSKQLEDLGAQGVPPAHPELLDALAVSFRESGWDIKKLVRTIVTSRTYRQSSRPRPELADRDPENRWFARQSRWRLPAEHVRDNALFVSGLLVDGAPKQGYAKPYQPAGYYRHLNFPRRRYQHHRDARQWMRGVYMHWQRQFLHPALRAFDAPTREECCAERPVSNTPQAALTLLNDPTFVEAARAFASRILARDGDDRKRIHHAFTLATSRTPQPEESAVLLRVLAKHRSQFRGDRRAANALASVGLAPHAKSTEPAEVAAWTSVARVLLNLNETMTRN